MAGGDWTLCFASGLAAGLALRWVWQKLAAIAEEGIDDEFGPEGARHAPRRWRNGGAL